MGRRIVVTVVVLSVGRLAAGQELIPNPSFEQYKACPTTTAELSLADYWSYPTVGTSDYFHECHTGGSVGVPISAVGEQVPFHGSAYGGFIALYPALPDYREYLQTPLLGGGLEAGKTYRFSMQLSLAEDSSAATDRIGAYFSPTAVSSADYFDLPFTPQVEHPAGDFLPDTLEWMEVEQTFVADGGEQYVTIGNFHDLADSATVAAGSGPAPPLQVGTAYYFIDVVSLQCQLCEHHLDDMLTWWPLDEPDGTTAFDIVYGINGTHVGAPVPTTGFVQSSLDFLASGISIPTAPEIERDTGDVSLVAWVRVDALGTAQALMTKIASSGPGYGVFVNPDGTIGFTMVDAALDSVSASSTEAVTAGEWASVVVGVDRDDPSGGTIWVNGVPTTFDPTGAPDSLTNALPLRFAQDGGSGLGLDLDGGLDEVQVYNRALFPAEVELLQETLSAGFCKVFLEIEPVVGVPVTPGTTPVITTSGNVTNGTDLTGTFTLTARGEPAGTRCGARVSTVDGPANPVVLPPQVQLAADQTFPVRVRMDQPKDLGGGLACYSITATHLESGRTFRTLGLLHGMRGMDNPQPR